MRRIYLTSSAIIFITSLFFLGCPETSFAQVNMEAPKNFNLPIFVTQEINEPQENLDYMVDTWSSPVTKDEVKEITSIMDFWSDETKAKYKHDAFREIWVVNLKDYPDWQLDVSEIPTEQKAIGPNVDYTDEQLDIVANADYNDHLRFSARFNSTRIETGEVEENVLVSQSMSLVPETQAIYKDGFEGLVAYLKKASKDEVKHVKRNEVGRCRIFFTVTNEGTINEVKLVESSNYSDVDEALIKIVKDMPRKWTPAQDENGEKVDQEFVFTFGLAGC